MTEWLRLDATMPSHPKVVGLTDRAYRAFVDGLCYCRLQSTDGALPAPALKLVAPRSTKTTASELVSAGLWEPNGAGYVVHDWLDYQPSAAQLEQERSELHEVRSAAGRRGAAARWHGKGDGKDHGK